MTAAPLPETARGSRPAVFDDPATEALLGMILELARDHWIAKNRLATLEHWAAHAVTGSTMAWSENYRLPPDAEQALAAERDAFIARLLKPASTL